MNQKRIREFTLEELQKLNEKIYGVVNGRHFERWQMLVRLQRYASQLAGIARLHPSVRRPEVSSYALAMALSWTCAIVNRLGGIKLGVTFASDRLLDFQARCSSGANDGVDSFETATLSLADHVGRLGEALEHHQSLHNIRQFDEEVVPRLHNVLLAICRVATHANVELAGEMERCFERGCHKCRRTPCSGCGYDHAKMV